MTKTNNNHQQIKPNGISPKVTPMKDKYRSAGANNPQKKVKLVTMGKAIPELELKGSPDNVDNHSPLSNNPNRNLEKVVPSQDKIVDTPNRTSELEKAVWRINKEKEYNELYIKLDDLECEIKEDFSGVLIKKGNISYIFQSIRRHFFSKMIKELKSNWGIIQNNNNRIWELERNVEEAELKGIKSERQRCLEIIDEWSKTYSLLNNSMALDKLRKLIES